MIKIKLKRRSKKSNGRVGPISKVACIFLLTVNLLRRGGENLMLLDDQTGNSTAKPTTSLLQANYTSGLEIFRPTTNNNNNEAIVTINGEKTKRMARYRDLYSYEAPTPRSSVNEALCGPSPAFDDYFKISQARSVNNEDRTIYQLFAEQFRSLNGAGHYIEMGAFDGITESNSRFFDECLGWSGLLVEANPNKYPKLVENRPHSHRMNYAPSCNEEEELQNKTLPFHATAYTNSGIQGATKSFRDDFRLKNVSCGRLTPVVEDVLDGTVHFFSLDVEGSEPSVLKNIDFTKIHIDLLMVENWNAWCPKKGYCQSREEARQIMHEAGYKLYSSIVVKSDLYVHPTSTFQLKTTPDSWQESTGSDPFKPTTKNNEVITNGDTQKRMARYRDMYRYLAPTPRSSINGPLCGPSPGFDDYFKISQARSVNREDHTIYQLFAEQFRALGGSGRYIEMGAFDGITESNSRFFDECLGWSGLLVEANPAKYPELVKNRPHSHRMNYAPSCNLEDERANKTLPFHATDWTNSAIQGASKSFRDDFRLKHVPCGRLTPVVEDVLDGTVHFFSLDVEGSEPSVLKNIDFTKIHIDLLMVENWNTWCPKNDHCQSREDARQIMHEAGYKLYSSIVVKSDLYVHPKSMFQLKTAPDSWQAESTGPEVITNGEKTKRMARYRNLYSYKVAKPRSSINEALCGPSPAFDDYFKISQARSVNNEDRTIYQLFAEQFRSMNGAGHYIEMGAFDGITESNSRFFDECLGWSGLLVEANPNKYPKLVENRPHAHRMNYAPSCSEEEEVQNKTLPFHATAYTNSGIQGATKSFRDDFRLKNVSCGRLTPVVEDVLDGTVHFFSLDVEGSEPSVLKNIDFTKIHIDLLMVENWNAWCPKEGYCQSREEARKIMHEAGYKLYSSIVVKSDLYIHPKSTFQLETPPPDSWKGL